MCPRGVETGLRRPGLAVLKGVVVQYRRASRNPPIQCVCGETHHLNPAAACIVIAAFLRGRLQNVTPDGIVGLCILRALDDEECVSLYPGRIVRAE